MIDVLSVASFLVVLGGGTGPFDLILTSGRIVDGTGAPWYRADVGIRGDKIAAIGDLKDAKTTRRIDASKLVVAPGFIDMLGQSEYNVFVDNRAASKITQGITTEITGEGHAIAPVNTKMTDADAAIGKNYGAKARGGMKKVGTTSAFSSPAVESADSDLPVPP